MKTLSTLFFSFFVICLSAQHPGDLYTDFGEEGIYEIENADTLFIAYAIEVTTDGSIIAAGNYTKLSDSDEQIFVTKLDKQGNPVPFGNFSHGFQYGFTDTESAKTVAILPDNKILVAGNYFYEGEYYPFVIRLLSNGQPDTEFGTNGVFTYSLKSMVVFGMDIYYTADSYSILLCGSCQDTAQLMMVGNDGTIENSFGNNGFVQFRQYRTLFIDIDIDSENNDMYVCQYDYVSIRTCVSKYNLPAGIPDTDFGEDGILNYYEYISVLRKIIFNPEENTLTGFGRYQAEFDFDIFACRFYAYDGNEDLSFGVGGFSVLPVPSTDEYLQSAIPQSDGKYYYVVNSYFGSGTETYIGRINHNGYADASFGTNGFVDSDFELGDNMYNTLRLSPEEDILYVAGYKSAIHDNLKIEAYHTGYSNISAVDQAESLVKADFFYPNPVKDVLTIETGLNGLQQVQIFDITGKELLKYNFTGESFMLNLEMLQPSVYFIKVTLPDKQVNTMKLIKH